MPANTINSVSPDIRDFLLLKNIISDTVLDNGLEAFLQGISYPVEIPSLTPNVVASPNLENVGNEYRIENVLKNEYQGDSDDYARVEIILNQNPNLVGPFDPYNIDDVKLLNNSTEIRKETVVKNKYVGEDQQRIVDMRLNPVTTYSNSQPYLDVNGNLNVGGPSTDILDIVGSFLNGQGVAFSPDGILTNEDVRATLAGRGLTAIGTINDTPIGQIGGNQLGLHIAYNAQFGLQQETLGNLNLNPLSLLTGNALVVPNYDITVPKGKFGKAANFFASALGLNEPFTLLQDSASIFTFGDKLNVIYQTNIGRANNMIESTGKGQVLALFAQMNANLQMNNVGGVRQGYAPGFEDDRVGNRVNRADGINPNIYARGDGNGDIIDFVNGEANSLVASGNYDRSGQIDDDGFGASTTETIDGRLDFNWNDEYDNKAISTFIQNATFTEPKSILYKTKEMFNSNKMRTLTTGKAARVPKGATQIQSAVRSNLMSKGSGVLTKEAVLGELVESGLTANIFARTWTTYDQYVRVSDLQKHRGLYSDGRRNVRASVLEDNGFVRIGPRLQDKVDGNIKRFMFSIENLAWDGETANLLDSEIGPGDLQSGTKGRIMWFPPYDISFNENTNANWDKNEFIGRGEPVYTYNNTERTGTLQWKIIIDHPNYLCWMKSENNEVISSFFAGELTPDNLTRVAPQLTANELNQFTLLTNTKPRTLVRDAEPEPEPFTVYFPDGIFSMPFTNGDTDVTYEDGKINSIINIDYSIAPKGVPYGLGSKWYDLSNYGLNGWQQPIVLDGITYDGWLDTRWADAMKTYMTEKCPHCKVKITGFASKRNADNIGGNDKIAQNRAEDVADYFREFILTDFTTEQQDKRLVIENGGETGPSINSNSRRDTREEKLARSATVEFEYDPTLIEDDTLLAIDPETISAIPNIPVGRFFNECEYFEKLAQTDQIAYSRIREKIKFFQPAFHSVTPEGFNSRLTFLQQCTRQGPTRGGAAVQGTPENLAFGRPPVCILRIGDFYHTKIIIESLSFDFEPLVWDLNPEGVGVQPMIATVNMNFAFIGGHSIEGPINKLQNAVTFNYFANTEFYEDRSDRILLNTEMAEVSSNSNGVLINNEPDASGGLSFPSSVPIPLNGIDNNINYPEPSQEELLNFELLGRTYYDDSESNLA